MVFLHKFSDNNHTIMASPLAQTYSRITAWIRIRSGLEGNVSQKNTLKIAMIFLQCAAAACIVVIISGIVLSMWYEPSSRPIIDNNGNMQALAFAHTLIIDTHGDTLALSGEAFTVPLSKDRKPMFFDSAMASHSTVVCNHNGIPVRLHAAAGSIEIELTNRHPTGAWLRAIHLWAVHMFMLSLIAGVLAMIIKSSWRAPNEVLWFCIIGLMGVAALSAWTGSLLPWTVFSAVSAQIVGGFIRDYLPIIGNECSQLFLQGNDISEHTLPRVYSLHSIILPVIMVMLWWYVHILYKRLHGTLLFGSQTWSRIIAVLPLIIMILAYSISPIRVGPSFIPADTSLPITALADTKPSWYFLPFFSLLNNVPADAAMLILLAIFGCTVCLPAFDKRLPSWLLYAITIATILIFVWLGINGLMQ
jgi:quinol-cytochrome oxidoreductase complex cytochrome b subunit